MKALVLVSCVAAAAAQMSQIRNVIDLLGDLKVKGQQQMQAMEDAYKAWQATFAAAKDQYEDAITNGDQDKVDYQAIIDEESGNVAALNGLIADLAAKLSNAEAQLAEATKNRKDANKAFGAAEKELLEVIDAIMRAGRILRNAGVIEGATAGNAAKFNGFIQQLQGAVSTILAATQVSSASKEKLAALVQSAESEDSEQPQGAVYESSSGGIFDMLANLKDKTEAQLADLRRTEMEENHAYEMLAQGLRDEIAQFNTDLAGAKAEKATAEAKQGEAEKALATTNTNYAADTAALKALIAQHGEKTQAFNEFEANHRTEQEALTAAQNILSERFGLVQTGRKAFIQTKTKDTDVREEVAQILLETSKHGNHASLAQLANRVRDGDDTFGKVKGLISEMIARLKKAAQQEAEKKSFCDGELAKSEAKHANLDNELSRKTTRMEQAKAAIEGLEMKNADLSGEVAELTKTASELEAQRNAENKEYNENAEEYKSALEALAKAIDVIHSYFSQDRGANTSSVSESSSTIIAALESAQSDYMLMKAEGNATEEAAKVAYKEFVQKTKVSLAKKNATIKGQESEIKSLEGTVLDLKGDADTTGKELDAVSNYLAKIREDCTHKAQTFEERAAARQKEIDGLREALRILADETAGASFMQIRSH